MNIDYLELARLNRENAVAACAVAERTERPVSLFPVPARPKAALRVPPSIFSSRDNNLIAA